MAAVDALLERGNGASARRPPGCRCRSRCRRCASWSARAVHGAWRRGYGDLSRQRLRTGELRLHLRPRVDQAPLRRGPRRTRSPRAAPSSSSRCSGPRSVLLLGGRRAPAPPQADAAAVPRRADALLRGDDRRGDRAERRRWPAGEPFALHPQHAGDHPRGDPARRLRRRRRAAPRRAARAPRRASWRDRPRRAPSASSSPGVRGCRPLPAARSRLIEAIDELLAAEIAERRADPSLEERDDILSMLIAARFEDGVRMERRASCATS